MKNKIVVLWSYLIFFLVPMDAIYSSKEIIDEKLKNGSKNIKWSEETIFNHDSILESENQSNFEESEKPLFIEDISEKDQEYLFQLPYDRDPFLVPNLNISLRDDSNFFESSNGILDQDLIVKGIWKEAEGQWKAILLDSSKIPKIVKIGDKLGEIEIVAISEYTVTLKFYEIDIKGFIVPKEQTLNL